MDWTKQIGRYVLVMLLQVLLFNHMGILGVCHPYVYILCLLMMPITLPQSVDLMIGALVGLIMDIFCNSLGIHMASCTLLMFLRSYLIGHIVSDKDRLTEQLSMRTIGESAMMRYVVIMVVIHHLTIFLLSAWGWAHIGFAVVETLVSSLVTSLLILGYNMLYHR